MLYKKGQCSSIYAIIVFLEESGRKKGFGRLKKQLMGYQSKRMWFSGRTPS